MNTKNVLKLVLIACFANFVATGRHLRQEESINASKQIIEAIEKCGKEASSSAFHYGYEEILVDSVNHVECGKTTMSDITRVMENSIKDEKLLEEVLSVSRKAIKNQTTFNDMAGFIEKVMNKRDSIEWLVSVNYLSAPTKPLEDECKSDHMDLAIYRLRIRIIDIKPRTDRCSQSSTSSPSLSTTTNRQQNLLSKLVRGHLRSSRESKDENSDESSNKFQKFLIHLSAAQNSLPMVKYLIEEKGISVDLKDPNSRTPAASASANDSLEVLQYLLEKGSANPYTKDSQGNTLIHIASEHNSLNVLRYLIKNQRLDPDSRNQMGDTPLHVSAAAGNMNVVRLLVDSKVDIDATNSNGTTPLAGAALNDQSQVVKYLIANGATPVLIPETKQNKDMVKYLKSELSILKGKADGFDLMKHLNKSLEDNNLLEFRKIFEVREISPDRKFSGGLTFLHYAVENHRPSFVKYLIEQLKVDPNSVDDFNRSPIHYAAGKSIDILTYLAQHGGDVNHKDSKGASPVHYAIIARRKDILFCLIDQLNADPNTTLVNGFQLIHFAALYGCPDCVRYLIERAKLNVDARTNLDFTPLMEAAKSKRLDVVQFLVDEAKANLTAVDYENKNALQSAQEVEGNDEVIEYLKYKFEELEKLEEKDKLDGKTRPKEEDDKFDLVNEFTDALQSGDLNALKKIFERPKSLSFKFTNDKTFLHFAVDYNHLSFIKYLIENLHMNPNVNDKNGLTPLSYARSLEIVKYLIRHGAHLDAREYKTGKHIIHLAAGRGSLSIVRYLIEAKNVDPNIQDLLGNTPIHYASNRPNVVKYLSKWANEEKMAKRKSNVQ